MDRDVRTMRALAAAALLASSCSAFAQAQAKAVSPDVERGRYLVHVAGCNDCHTAGYPESNGKLPEQQWLMGSPLGWRGPWGTTYAPNLRRTLAAMTEAQWLTLVRTQELRPPMPWFNLRAMSERDLRAVYRYVRHLGPAGAEAPAWVPPGREPSGPYIQFPAPPKP